MKQKIYLAGGYHSGWQEIVKEQLGDCFICFDPKSKEFKNGERVRMELEEYGTWDLHHIRLSDVVFVYLERTNPGCIGAVIEAGYAKGIGKTVVTVLEDNNEKIEDRYLQFVKKVSDITFSDFDSGIAFLKSLHI